MQRLLVNQAKITEIEAQDLEPVALQDGQARLTLKRFAITANNVTYAATGFVIKYWEFFPSGVEGKGIVPVWGFAEVVESRSEHLEVGQRLYGVFPMAEEFAMTPEPQGDGVILDVSPHRKDLPIVYSRYVPVKPRSAEEEGYQALLQPLLATSFLLSDWLRDNGFFKAEQVIVGSASSKTGLGLCKFLAELSPRPVKVIGLTSEGNKGFVKSHGGCDQVISYDDLNSVAQVPSVYVDMAGNAAVRRALHTHLGDLLKHSSAVGMAHWDKFRQGEDLPGPKPEFFFAPAQIEKRRADWGPGVIEGQIGEAWRRIAGDAGSWLTIAEHDGLASTLEIYRAHATGQADPKRGDVVTL